MADRLFDALTDRHRRRLLVALLTENPQPTTRVLEEVYADDYDLDDLKIELWHTHLPKLAADDLIEWDRETNTVSRGPRFQDIRPLIDVLVDRSEDFPDDLL